MADGKIVIETGIDLTGLKNGLDSIKDSLSGLNKQMSNTFKFDGSKYSVPIQKSKEETNGFTGSVKNLAASFGLIKIASMAMDVLSDSISGATSRFDTMQKYPKVMEALGISSDQSTASVKKLSDGIDGLPTALDTVVATTQRMTSMNGNIEKSTDATIALNNAFLASGSSTEDASRGMEQYLQMMAKGTVDLQSWRTLQETMPVALQKVAEAFGLTGESAQRDLYAKLQSGEITFDQFQDKLIELGTGTGELASLARTNSEGIATSFSNLKTAVVKGLAYVMDKVNSSVQQVTGLSIAEHLNSLKGIINIVFKSIGDSLSIVIPIIANIITVISDVVGKIIEFIKPMLPIIVAVAAAFATWATITQVILPIAVEVIKIVLAVEKAISIIAGLANAPSILMAIGSAIGALGGPIVIIIALIAAAVAAVIYLWNTNEGFRNAVITAWNAINAVGGAVWGAISNFFLVVLPGAMASAQAACQAMADGFLAFVSMVWGGINNASAAFVNFFMVTIPGAIQSAIDWLVANGSAIIGWIVNPVGSALGLLYNQCPQFRAVVDTAMAGVQAGLEVGGNVMHGIIGAIGAWMTGDTQGMKDSILYIWNSLPGPVQDALMGMYNVVTNAIDSVKAWIDGKVNDFIEAGRNLILGLRDGIVGGITGAVDAVKNGIGGMVDGVKAMLGIHSPSTVFYAIGQNMFAGLAMAIADSDFSGLATQTATDFSNSFSNAATFSTSNTATVGYTSAAPSTTATPPIAEGLTAQQDDVKTAADTTYGEIATSSQEKTDEASTTLNTSLSNQEAAIEAQAPTVQATSELTYSGINTAATNESTLAYNSVLANMNAIVSYINGGDSNGYPSSLLSACTLTFDAIRQAGYDRSLAAEQSIITNMQAAIQWLIDARPQMVSAGDEMINGLNQGIDETIKGSSPVAKLEDLAKQMLQKFKDALGIHSPSKEMEQIGFYIMQGLINGLSPDELMQFVNSTIDQIKAAYANGTLDIPKLAAFLGPDAGRLFKEWGISYGGHGLDGALSIFGNLLDDDSHGYSQSNRWGPDYDCSSSIIYSLKTAGIDTGNASYTGNMSDELTSRGWDRLPIPDDAPNGLEKGDILLNDAEHVGWWLGDSIGAFHSDYDGSPGDSSGREANRTPWYNHPWNAILRYNSPADLNGDLASWISTALAITGQSQDLLQGLIYAAQSESSGNPNAINLWDSNAAAGHPSKGLFQTIDSTFDAYKLPGYDNIFDPVSNAIAAIRYMIDRYGSVANVVNPRLGGWYGYSVGSRYITQDQFARIHEGEAVIQKVDNPYANSGGGFVTKMLQDSVDATMGEFATRMAAQASTTINQIDNGQNTPLTQNVYFQETPTRPSEMRAALRQEGRKLAFGK